MIKSSRLLFLGILFFTHFKVYASATDVDLLTVRGKQGMQVSLHQLNNSVWDLQQVRFTLNVIFEYATLRMQMAGYDKEANDLRNDWQVASELYFSGGFSPLDLGDHEPLSLWLRHSYEKIERVLGKRFCARTRIDDIKNINYGYPVSIHPEGNPSTHLAWGKDEYLKHFVPFTAATTYWTGRVSCALSLNIVGSLICGWVLEIPRYHIETYIAPSVGEDIYNRYNR